MGGFCHDQRRGDFLLDEGRGREDVSHSVLPRVLPGGLEDGVEFSEVPSHLDEVEMISAGDGVILIQFWELGMQEVPTARYSVHEGLEVGDGRIHAIPREEKTEGAGELRSIVETGFQRDGRGIGGIQHIEQRRKERGVLRVLGHGQ